MNAMMAERILIIEDDRIDTQLMKYNLEFFEKTVQGIFQIDHSGKLITADQFFANILGYGSPEELLELSSDAKRHFASEERFEELLAALGKNRCVKDFDFQACRKDGNQIWLSANMRSLCNSDRSELYYKGIVKDISPPRKIENMFRSALARQAAILSTVPDIIMEVNANKIYTWANRAGFEFFGDDVIGKEAAHYFEEDRDIYIKVGSIFNGDDNLVCVESWQRRNDGQKRLLAWRCQGLKDNNGKVIGAISSARDITDSKLGDIARLEALTRQVQLNQLQQDLLGTGNLTDKLKEITEGAVDIFGADFCRIWLMGDGDLCSAGCIHAAVSEGFNVCQNKDKCLRLVASSGRYTHTNGAAHQRIPFGAYKIGRIASGEERLIFTNDVANDPGISDHDWAKSLGLVSFAGFQLRSSDSKILGVMALFSTHAISADEHAQVDTLSATATRVILTSRSEQAIKETKEYLNEIINCIADPVFVKDRQLKFVLVNNAMCSFSRRSPDEILGLTVDHWLPKQQADLIKQQEESVFESGNECIVEEEVNVNQNEKRTVMARKALLTNKSGEKQIVGVIRDITEMKQAEEQRQQMQIQLQQGQKLEAIGQLAAGIAHEINTPTQYVGDNVHFMQDAYGDLMKVLEQYARLLQESHNGNVSPSLVTEIETAVVEADFAYLAEEIPKAITQSLDGLNRISTIVCAMKEFSHPDSGEKQAIDLNHAIKNTLTVCRNEWKYVAEIAMDLDGSLPLVSCLPGVFNQVILNLIVNAAHAITEATNNGEKGKGTIGVITRLNGDWAKIMISDTGTGIPEKNRSKIFTPFFTTKGIGKGTGQGLALCHSAIVGKHGGTLEFETEAGKGTTFIIGLPLSSSLSTPDAGTKTVH
jgi:PAS domain S-box-containing protein